MSNRTFQTLITTLIMTLIVRVYREGYREGMVRVVIGLLSCTYIFAAPQISRPVSLLLAHTLLK